MEGGILADLLHAKQNYIISTSAG